MKKLIIALTLLTIFATVPPAMARGNHRFALDQKWKQLEAWQKQEARKFKAIEAEAKALLSDVKAGGDRDSAK